MKTEFLGKTLSGPFTVPSGIVTTATSIIQYMFDHMPQIGVITTKSVGPEPRAGNREPVYSQYSPGNFVNAVGLTNPGALADAEAMATLRIPEDRFLLVSIFGGSLEEFVDVAKIMAPVANGLELNLSCPHAKGYGMAMGQDPEMVRAITAAVKAVVNIPVIPKLTPNTPNIGEIALAAAAGGADGICAINTVGPGYTASHGHPVLSNGAGGMSGKGILPIALKCVREIRAVTDIPIIGCGGASSAADTREFINAGASIVGIGSALTGMTTDEIGSYFNQLESDLCFDSDKAEAHIRYDIDMDYSPVVLVENKRVCNDICVLTFDRKVNIQAGEFVFLWVPGVGEKPFSALADDPFQLAVIDVGIFTHALMDLEVGTEVYVRGPHGIPVSRLKMPRSWPLPAELVWRLFISWLETLATLRYLQVRAPQNDSTISTSVKRSPRFTWRPMMAARALKALSPSCCAVGLKRWISRSSISWCFTTAALHPWCTPRRKYSASSVAMIKFLVQLTI